MPPCKRPGYPHADPFQRVARRARSLAVAALAGVAFAASAQTVLRVSAIPDEAPTELARKFTPLGALPAKPSWA